RCWTRRRGDQSLPDRAAAPCGRSLAPFQPGRCAGRRWQAGRGIDLLREMPRAISGPLGCALQRGAVVRTARAGEHGDQALQRREAVAETLTGTLGHTDRASEIMRVDEHRIEVEPWIEVSSVWAYPAGYSAGASPSLILAHGAGNDMRSPF